ncbi:MAG: hypothetical protein EOP04_12635 [Proteobacteria bacterium]|nr:MAG: hypothetical protein EOP04_12635 [Pseudomonadota bacterium]
MLKSQLGINEVLKVIGLVRSFLRFGLREWEGDGLTWKDVQKYLKSEEFQAFVAEIIGGFTFEASETGGARVPNGPVEYTSAALRASERVIEDLKAKSSARLAG